MVHRMDRPAAGTDSTRTHTLVDVLRSRCDKMPNRPAYTYLLDGETAEVTWTYSDLQLRAEKVANLLVESGLEPGDRALLIYPPGLEFIGAFFGCLMSGVIAVPVYPPTSARDFPRLLAVLEDCGPKIILTASELLLAIQREAGAVLDALPYAWRATDAIAVDDEHTGFTDRIIANDHLAFLQYTSGSTGKPKGVMVSHANILANEAMIQASFRHDETARIVGWLPVYHDMGLIGNVLQPLYIGAECILMSPQAFLEKPIRWLRAISRYRATTSGGPNFSYALCARKTKPAERKGLDLSTWTLAFNGAEPIRTETLDRFVEEFSPYGFHRATFYPCYGLAEATLFVTGGSKEQEPVFHDFSKSALEKHRLSAPRSPSSADRQTLVGCGRPWLSQTVSIVDPETFEKKPEGVIGEIWIAGPNVAKGYWKKEKETEETFHAYTSNGDGPFLRTGDLGSFHGAELIVTGRVKDLIILRGRNFYPQDIERVVEQSHPGLRPGCGVAFSTYQGEEERLILVQECRDSVSVEQEDEICRAIRAAVMQSFGQTCFDVVLLAPNSLSKTSSGKLRRSHARDQYGKGAFQEKTLAYAVHRSPQAPPRQTRADRPETPPTPRHCRPEQDTTTLFEIVQNLVLAGTSTPLSATPDFTLETTLSSLGIDSISLVELSSLIGNHFSREITPQQLIELDSLARITERLYGNDFDDIPSPSTAEGWSLRSASSVEDLEAVYRLRYEVYVEEMNLPQPYANRNRRLIFDPLDPDSHILTAVDGKGQTIGTLRSTSLATPMASPYLTILGIEGMPKSRLRYSSLSSRLAVAPEYRATTLALHLCRAQYQHAKARGVTLDYAYCYSEMLPFFLRLGYEHVRDNAQHPEFGAVNVVCLDVQDDESLIKSRSPLIFDDLTVRSLSFVG